MSVAIPRSKAGISREDEIYVLDKSKYLKVAIPPSKVGISSKKKCIEAYRSLDEVAIPRSKAGISSSRTSQ